MSSLVNLIGGIGIALLSVLIAIVVATGARLAAEDVKEWAPAIAAHFVQSAIQFVPINQRDEAAKEWPSRVTDTPGALSKIIVSIRFLLRAKRMMRASSLGEGRSQRRVGKPSTMTFSAFIVILAAGIFVILGAIIITAGPQLGHPGHTAWGSFQVAYLCMVSINVTLLALPTARTPILAAESARWESLTKFIDIGNPMFSLARERFIAFKREAYEIDSLSNIIRGLSLALAAISFAMLMLATALSEQFADPLLAWGMIVIGLLPVITLFALNYSAGIRIRTHMNVRQQLEAEALMAEPK